MKKIIGILFAAVLACGLFFLFPENAKAETSGIYTYRVQNGCAVITAVDPSVSGDLVVPATLDGYPVTETYVYPFQGCQDLTSVTFSEGFLKLQSMTFNNCPNLVSCTIPESTKVIGSSVFRNCPSIHSFHIGKNVETIGTAPFSGSGVTTLTVSPENPTFAFSGNCLINKTTKALIQALPGAVIPTDGSVTVIGSQAFSGRTDLTTLTVPSGITGIDPSAFYNCTSLTSVSFPPTLTSIGYSAFEGCTSLTSFTLPASVTTFGAGVLSGCTSLTSFAVEAGNPVYTARGNCLIETATKTLVLGFANSVIPADGSVTVIGASAFSYCAGLTSVSIPASVTTIGDSAFSSCSDLTSVTLRSGLKTIEARAFRYTGITSVTLPDGVETIGTACFANCASLVSAVLPDSVTTLGTNCFDGCTSLASVRLPSGLTEIPSYTFRRAGLTSFEVPASVTAIGYCAFDSCDKLESVTLPGELRTIDSMAFSACTKLKSVNLPSSLSGIGDWAFESCVSLEEVILPEGVTTIPDGAFSNCISLRAVVLPASLRSIGNSAFQGCTGVGRAVFWGTEDQWNAVTKGYNNGAVTYAIYASELGVAGRTVIFDSAFSARYLFKQSAYLIATNAGATVRSVTVTVGGETRDLTSVVAEDSDQSGFFDGAWYYWTIVGGIAPKDVTQEFLFRVEVEYHGYVIVDEYTDSVFGALQQATTDAGSSPYLINAAKATLNYCKAAGAVFGTDAAEIACDFTPSVTPFGAISEPAYGDEPIKYAGTSILLKDELELKFWVKPGSFSGSIDDLTVFFGGAETQAERAVNGAYWTFKFRIPVGEAAESRVLQLYAGGEQVSQTMFGSVADYAAQLYSSDRTLAMAILGYVYYVNEYLSNPS